MNNKALSRLRHHAVLLILACSLLVVASSFTACSSTELAQEPAPVPAGPQKHPLKGIVVSAVPDTKNIIVEHQKIPDVMDEMRMAFAVPSDAERASMTPGSKIEATLVMEDNTMWLEEVKVTGQGEVPPPGENDGPRHTH